jgi:hypothetical protein
MRELEVLNDGHLKLDFAGRKEFFEQELHQQVRATERSDGMKADISTLHKPDILILRRQGSNGTVNAK